MATGASREQVAHDLGISANTVKHHLESVYQRLDVSSVLGAIDALGWLHIDCPAPVVDQAVREMREAVELYDALIGDDGPVN